MVCPSFEGMNRHYLYITLRRRVLVIYVCTLFAMATVGLSLQIWWCGLAFIDNRDYPGGAFEFLRENSNHPVHIALTVIYVVLNWLCDGMLLYRFYIICSAGCTYRRIPLITSISLFLILITVGSIFMVDIAYLATGASVPAPAIVYMFISLFIHTLLTILIISRIIYLRRNVQILGPNYGKQYSSIIALFVESASIYTVWILVAAIVSAVNSPVQYAFVAALGQIQAIPPLLITSRVVYGRVMQNSYSTLTFKTHFTTFEDIYLPDSGKQQIDTIGKANARIFPSIMDSTDDLGNTLVDPFPLTQHGDIRYESRSPISKRTPPIITHNIDLAIPENAHIYTPLSPARSISTIGSCLI
ncbi:hypothetical protein C8Q75DRAFT_448029 [Abortiporus biennis]|nr:hypothetical protein C8Q75DRAFT_448029 [Abortiporus biennis]